jgi:hypothetical protein
MAPSGVQGTSGRNGATELALGEAAAEGLAKLVLHRTPLNPNWLSGPPADALEEPVVVQVREEIQCCVQAIT